MGYYIIYNMDGLKPLPCPRFILSVAEQLQESDAFPQSGSQRVGTGRMTIEGVFTMFYDYIKHGNYNII